MQYLWLAWLGWGLLVPSNWAWCEDYPSRVQEEKLQAQASAIQFFADQSLASFASGAGALGAMGMELGLGLQSGAIPKRAQKVVADGLGAESSSTLTMPKLWLSKGLLYPVNGGIVLSAIPNGRVGYYGLLLQWTVYESMASPAFAVRGFFRRWYGLELASMESASLGGLLSWGLGFMSAYLGYDINFHRRRMEVASYSEKFYSEVTKNKAWIQSSSLFGLSFMWVPFLAKLGIEASWSKRDLASISGKLSFRI